jgi:hypothetical protein
LLGRLPRQNPNYKKSQGKGKFFGEMMGFIDETLDVALHSHLINNFDKATIAGSKIVVEGIMTGPSGRTENVLSVWQVTSGGFVAFVTAYPSKEVDE